MYIFPEDSEEKLEFPHIRGRIRDYCRLQSAMETAASLQPFRSYPEAQVALEETAEYLSILQNGSYFPDSHIEEISRELALLRTPGSVLAEKQVMDIRLCIYTAGTILRFLSDKTTVHPALCRMSASSERLEFVVDLIDSILDPHGVVKSSASPELASIRRDLDRKRREHDRIFNSLLQKLRRADLLSETGESYMNGRRVLSFYSEHKRENRGIIHGSSNTGKVTYIEPSETIELNNDITLLESEEKREIRRIMKDLTAALRSSAEAITAQFHFMIRLDFTRAKALYGREINAVVPFVHSRPSTTLVNAFHPVLLEQNKRLSKPVVPLNISLSQGNSILVISGPNAGGKSIALKTTGLLQMMIQSGLAIPAAPQSEMGWYRNLMTDIGDAQSIEYELSTYSSRLKRMKHFLQRAGKHTLILIDEFGTGTDPELGGALAEVILEELSASGCFGIITTHYNNIKIAGEKLPNVQNGCMLFDDDTLNPLYRLETGKPGSSYTFVIAEKSGIPKAIVNRAKSKTDRKKLKLDQLLNEIQVQKAKLEEQLKEAHKLQEKAKQSEHKYQDLFEKFRVKMEKLKGEREEEQKLIELGKRLQGLTEEWEKEKDKKKVIAGFVKVAGREKARKIEEKKKASEGKRKEKQIEKKLAVLKVGSTVRLNGGGRQTGVVEEINGKKAVVLFGSIRTIAGVEQLEVLD
jgi:DNA mismatch repair protein MutS2